MTNLGRSFILRFWEAHISWNFLGWNFIIHLPSNLTSLSMFCWNDSLSDPTLTSFWHMDSSDNSQMLQLRSLGISLIYSRNRHGRRTDPWGHMEALMRRKTCESLITTLCTRHLFNMPWMPFSLCTSGESLTLSNALEKSSIWMFSSKPAPTLATSFNTLGLISSGQLYECLTSGAACKHLQQ